MNRMCIAVLIIFVFAGSIFPLAVHAQELVPDTAVTMKAKVLEIISEERRQIPGTDVMSTYQTIRIEALDGLEKGDVVTVENDYLNMDVGDVFYLMHTTNSLDGTDYYTVIEPYRLPALGILVGLFIVVVLTFGGRQGLRGLLSLVASLLFILLFLLPGILQGYSPILVSLGVASLIVLIGSYVTHGFNRMTSTAVLGMIVTVLFTGLLAYLAIHFTHLSGYTGEETMYLNLNTRGAIDFAGLLMGAILIGTLGILYDAAIGQAVAVEELARAGGHLTRKEIYKRALRIGREHIGALVNTLAIAYVGASLPLLLLFYGFGTDSIALTLNRELFATEIVRSIVGSIGLVLAVPITTLIAAWLLVPNQKLRIN
ncbi:hypothetical protein COU18_02980 [Candidatus Kaiserbacteria bacterium CG10_big_fil_rev_8_21_14_0_10_51_14]|uniref:YibE/F family protein n=1 Tax=Candidatus Kaiserbacteria bacterium CG10_big_fil_rev_8_21_14_0_10_51_14 TaxID=1974610 RepID=A0A2H0UB35_9BACT|nr:MAG: hypothetical protein COU18_02980 [Candidatus Kaiserbacteria bacterium CG10_big_fil_rev_8_21_14_0_10_51_14]